MDAGISLNRIVVASGNQVSCSLEDEVAIVHLKAAAVACGLDRAGLGEVSDGASR
jgi:hypothetical protein